MNVRAVEKFIRISPKKARLVADSVRGQNAKKSMVALSFMPQKAAGVVYKALKSAVANAENNHNLDGDALVISKITIDQGPSLKRFKPRSRGMVSHILKRTSHVTVVVSAEEKKAEVKKAASTKEEATKKEANAEKPATEKVEE
jgi:large subunit ribosomal protein L22